MRRLVLFHVATPTALSRKMGGLVVEATGEVVEAVAGLKKMKGVMPALHRGSRSSKTRATSSFTTPSPRSSTTSLPAIEVIKWKDVYENMEHCLDKCELVAHVLESVVLKNS